MRPESPRNGEAMRSVSVAFAGRDARMISPVCDGGQGTHQTFVTRTFRIDAVNGPVMLHISALGLYRAYVNGKRVGDDYLTPGWTCYDDRIAFQSYDIAPLLATGDNRIDIWLGDGWYRSQILWASNPIFNCWGDRTGAIAVIATEARVLAATGADWKSGRSPVTRSGIYYGEDFDARIGLDANHAVEILDFDLSLLVPHETSPVRALDTRVPAERWTDAEGREVYDFGQNCGAVIRLTARGEAGATIRVEHAEVLGPDRAFDNRNYRSARAELVYTLKGEGEECYEPAFSFMGFRYVRVTVSGKAELVDIVMVPISSVHTVKAGFSSADPAVNRLVENTIWSQRSNFIEIPTDCPQRDERLGWTGDAQVFAGTACWLADCRSFLLKFLRDVMHDQRADGAIPHFSPDPTRLHPIDRRGDWAGSTGWGDAITVIPWQLYLHYGDTAVLEECFPAMTAWLDYLWSISDGPIIRPPSEWGARGFTFGDWLQPVGDNRKPRPTVADDCAATLYHFISTDLAARIAAILGRDEDRQRLVARAAEIRRAFGEEYFSSTGRIAHNDQTSWSLAFLHGLVPERHHEAAKAYFRRVVEDADGLIGTGFIGTPALLPALTRLGMTDLAEKIFLNRRVPGWLYQVERGATSIWERWDAIGEDGTIYEPDMNSYNHYAYGAVCQWLFENVAGVAPVAERPAFAEVLIDPTILPALSPVAAWHECGRGRIEAGWTVEGQRATYSLTLPEGVTGRLLQSASRRKVAVDGKPAEIAVDGLLLTSGRHVISFDFA
jgi:alpha-L-rhamnosidase